MSRSLVGTRALAARVPVTRVRVSAYRVPTDGPEADGTLGWEATTMVLVEVEAGGQWGLGYSYGDAAAATVADGQLAGLIVGKDAMDVPACWEAMIRQVRNAGRPGVVASAIAAVDAAMWDLKAKLLGLPLARLFGQVRAAVPVYGSGGFTNYAIDRLQAQLGDWAAAGMAMVKMKVGAEPGQDVARVRAARAAIGRAELFVDANGAYDRKQALAKAEAFAEHGVSWFEEPVSSDDLEGLRLLRDRGPAGMAIAAGEYAYGPDDFMRLLGAGAVDALQADATRCMGLSGFLRAGALAEAFHVPLSAHTAPSLHLPVCLALPAAAHIEYFYDHVRLEHMLFDGAATADGGMLRPDLGRLGLGLELKRQDAARFRI